MREIVFYYICVTLCTIATLVFSIQCLYKYLENEDVSKTTFKKFHQDPENIYPSLTLCMKNPYLEKTLRYHGEGVDIASYFSYLNGKVWSDRMQKIDYDNVTVSLHDNVLGISMELHNETRYMYNHLTGLQEPLGWKPNFYINVRREDRKCFSFEIPYVENRPVFNFKIYIHNNFFPKGFRTPYSKFNASNPESGGLLVYFHYPGQFETSFYTAIGEWNAKDNQSKPYTMQFNVKDVSVLKRRNKPEEECIENWRHYDRSIREDITKKAGCRPKYWNTTEYLKPCSSKEEIKRYIDKQKVADRQSAKPPCHSIHNMEVIYTEHEFQAGFEPASDFLNLKGY